MGFKDFLNKIGIGLPENANVQSKAPKTSVRLSEIKGVFNEIYEDCASQNSNWYPLPKLGSVAAYQRLKQQDAPFKVDVIFYLIKVYHEEAKILNAQRTWRSDDTQRVRQYVRQAVISALLRSSLDLNESELERLFQFYLKSSRAKAVKFNDWPIGFTVTQVERLVKKNGLTEHFQTYLKDISQWPEFDLERGYWGSDVRKARAKLEKILFSQNADDTLIAPVYKMSDKDDFGCYVQDLLSKLTDKERQYWYKFLHVAVKASSSKPTKAFLKESKECIDLIEKTRFKALINDCVAFVIALKAVETIHKEQWQGREYTHSTYTFLEGDNSTVLKGMVWAMVHFHDAKTLIGLAGLAERCFQKIPGVGPAAAGVGNAAIYVLAHSKGLEGISHLSRLKLKISQNNTRKLIQKYLEEASVKRGVSTQEIEEMSIPDFGLIAGQKEVSFGDYTLRIAMAGVGKTQMTWLKPDGKAQKTPPAFIRENKKLSDLLRKLKAELKQIQKYSTAQRDRIDRSFILDRSMGYQHFVKYYHTHGLVSAISSRLLWNFKTGDKIYAGIWHNEQWEDLEGNPISILPETTEVSLWHPIDSATDEVLAWRDKLDSLSWQQPIKQAYREIYLLTDAEVNTVVYSNRMAAHILKQHQFKALSAIRNWNYQLLGCYDDGREGEVCSLSLPHCGINVEYWINEIYMEDACNDAGIWDYVATDQLRFMNQSGQAIPLIDVPKIVFSEAMRDADLFVGVASVGNDPAWVDSGGNATRQYNDYWQSYSFGDLNEMAKTRKAVLERLIPRLKIRDVARIDGKFLRIKGTVREYKIHIGSTNILMEPNDQYLCIVPARGKGMDTGNLFIPFEGDRGLSLVLSKAMLLAADDKITDSTILSQIRR